MATNTGILFTADVHMKRRTWTNSTLLQGDAEAAFTKVANAVAPRYGLKGIWIGGDLFDSNRPTSQDLLSVKTILADNFRTCHYIRGNHDSVEPAYLEALANRDDDSLVITNASTGIYRITDDVYLTGIDWMPSSAATWDKLQNVVEEWRSLRGSEDDILYVMLHASFQHLLGFDGAYDFTTDMIKGLCGNDRINILVGHIHTRDTTIYNERGAYIHSPGSLYPLSTDKMGVPCYASYINLETGEIEAVNADVRKYVVSPLVEPEYQAILRWLNDSEAAPEEGQLPTFVIVPISGELNGPFPLMDDPRYIFKIDRIISVADPRDMSGVRTSYSISQAVRDELADSANRDMAIDMANEILESDDPIQTIEKWLEFWGVKKV